LKPVFGGLEAGGTKFVCAIGTGPDDIRSQVRIPTTTPDDTIGQVLGFFQGEIAKEPLAAIGVASFGPLDPHPASPTYGYLTATTKPGNWNQVDLLGPLKAAFGVPLGFDTDVSGAALAEGCWGNARDVEDFVYLTIGTGIGGGAVVRGEAVHGLLHLEMGHMILPRRSDDEFAGVCPFHGNCLEGLASGPAIEQRWGAKAEELPADHPAWDLEAHYLGLGLANIICTCSPQRIVLGGGVMHQRHLFPVVRESVRRTLNGYIQHEAITADNDAYIVPPGLGDRAGVLGAFALAERALAEQEGP
jgi:fructokinase